MRLTPRALATVGAVLAVLLTAGTAQAALPNQAADDTSMVDGASDAALGGGGVRVRAIAETAGGRIWVAGDFQEVDNSTGATLRAVNNLAAFTPSGALDSSVAMPDVTLNGGGAIVYDLSLSPSGILYLAGNFDSVGGVPRSNVAAIDPTTGAVLAFNPGVAAANAVFASSTAVFVGTGKLLSFQPNGVKSPGFTEPTVIIDAGIRAHTTIPQVRDIAEVGNTLVASCQCDSVTDATGTRPVKAAIEVDATTGNVRSWAPANLASSSGAFGISVLVRNATVYLAAGGSDFTAAYDFTTGAQLWKTDTSGSSQAIAWYQNQLIVGGHFDWVQKVGGPSSCQDNANPATGCWHAPKLVSLSPGTGQVNLVAGVPWNPGICCKYNGIWAIAPSVDGATLHVGGEFERVGGTWSGSGTNWSLSGAATQKYYAHLSGTAPATLPLTLTKAGTGSGAVSSSPAGISCGVSCAGASADFTAGQVVTLTPSAAAASTFTGWSGACAGSSTCQVTLDAVLSVAATFEPTSHALTVSKTGVGTGTVTSGVPGINCGTACSAFFLENASLTLTAVAGPNSAFNGWSGSGCSGTGSCVVPMNAAKSVTADFISTTKNLTVVKTKGATGVGAGTITSSPAGIACGSTCGPVAFSSGTVTLRAAAAAGSIFNGWSGGGCSGTTPMCVVTMDGDKTVTGDFEKARNVTVTIPTGTGFGAGTVTSTPVGIDCPATCSNSYPQGSTATLTAAPGANSVFTGWSGTGSGPGCAGTAPCVLTMDGGKLITATFAPAQTVTVIPAGSGSGTVTSNPAGINCGLTCTANYAGGNVTLTASPGANSSFTGWAGNCTGTGTCTVSMSAARTVTATFSLLQRQLTVSVNGLGTVTDTPGPITCPGTCTNTYEHGTDVLLSATASANWTFTGWTGDCTGSETTCVASMVVAHSVTATFEPQSGTLFVGKAGSGTGSVSSAPAGIGCGGDCVEGYAPGTPVTLTAAPDAGSVFTSWSGDCNGSSSTCDVTMDAVRNVTATFELSHQLTVVVNGGGSVTSDVGGIICPSACVSGPRVHGSHVVLTAAPDAGSIFTGWTGAGCSGTATTCDAAMNADEIVTASFIAARDLTVSVVGAGSVTSAPGPIACPGACAATYQDGENVTLTPTPSASASFTGWTGACTNATGDCVLTMDAAKSVTAMFAVAQRTLTVATAGTGNGSVTSDVGGIVCPGTCAGDFAHGTLVTLTATPAFNATFAGWSDDCAGASTTCQLTMDAAKSATAGFTLDATVTCNQILFVSTRTGDADVFAMNADGTGTPANLTASAGTDTDPSWSPDCSKVTFSSTRSGNADVWVMNANGSGLVQLTADPGSDTQPAWSGDGTRIAFVSTRDGDQEIFTMSAANGSALAQLTANTVTDTAPDWSADGSKILFMSKRLGTQIWVMNADGTVPVKRTSGLKVCDTPAFSPDGTKIVFTSTLSGTKQVWAGNTTGTLAAIRLTLDGFSDSNPTWSPDGSQIAYSGSQSGNNEIWVINANGTGSPSNRTNNAKSETLPNWSA